MKKKSENVLLNSLRVSFYKTVLHVICQHLQNKYIKLCYAKLILYRNRRHQLCLKQTKNSHAQDFRDPNGNKLVAQLIEPNSCSENMGLLKKILTAQQYDAKNIFISSIAQCGTSYSVISRKCFNSSIVLYTHFQTSSIDSLQNNAEFGYNI